MLAFLVVFTMATTAMASASSQPHIIFIVADDLGWDDVGFHGSDISTPNIDALAYSGIILNKYYVSPICSPTRSAIMTGRHPIHTGMHVDVIGGATPYGLPLNETIMPQFLQTLGYRRHIVGKWHLGFFEDSYLPTRRGFENFFGYYTGSEDYFDHESQDSGFYGLDLHQNEEAQWNLNGNFSTEMYTQEAERIIASHNSSEPLFLYLAHQAVHAGNGPDPLQVPQKYVDRFRHTIHDVKRRIFAGMVSALDDSVGRVVQALRGRGLYNNTIIVFTTDNGGPTNGYNGNAACNWPLRGVKNTVWEGGVRGVGFVNSPLFGNTSYVSDNFFHVTDWLPTLYSAAGGDPSTLPKQDGFDMFKMLKYNGPAVRKEVLHNIDPVNGFAAVRVGDFKLVEGHISDNDNGWYPPPNYHLSKTDSSAQNGNISTTSLKFTDTDLHSIIYRKHLRSRGKQDLKFSTFKRGHTRVPMSNNDYVDTSRDAHVPDSVDGLWHFSVSEEALSNRLMHAGSPIFVDCGKKPLNTSSNCRPEKAPCLFHILSDPCEYNNVADLYPDIVQQLLARLGDYRQTMVPPQNKPIDPQGNPFLHGGVWQPWVH